MAVSTRVALIGSLLAASFAAPAFAEDLVFDLHNKSSYNVIEFYASPSDVGDWEEDILGLDILASGDSTEETIADGRTQCEYDLRFVFDDESETVVQAEDICETGSFTITE